MKRLTMREEAESPATSPERLREFATKIRFQAIVAANPNTPIDVLLALVRVYPEEILANPMLPLYLLEEQVKGRLLQGEAMGFAFDKITYRLPLLFARYLAADCAGHVLPLFEAQFPADQRPRAAILVASSGLVATAGNQAAITAYLSAQTAEQDASTEQPDEITYGDTIWYIYSAVQAAIYTLLHDPSEAAIRASESAELTIYRLEMTTHKSTRMEATLKSYEEISWQYHRAKEYEAGVATKPLPLPPKP